MVITEVLIFLFHDEMYHWYRSALEVYMHKYVLYICHCPSEHSPVL